MQTEATLLGVLGDTSTHRVEGGGRGGGVHYRRVQAV